jgi:Uma2 family endonuclease
MATLSSSTRSSEELRYNLDRMECRKGKLTEKPLGGSKHHEYQLALTNVLRRLGSPHQYRAIQEWSVTHGSEWMIPDIAVAFPGYALDHRDYLIGPAYLCVEIVSKVQRLSTLFNKCEDYHAWGTRFCWVIDPDEPAFFEYHAGSAIVPVKQELSTDKFRVSIADLLAEIEQFS